MLKLFFALYNARCQFDLIWLIELRLIKQLRCFVRILVGKKNLLLLIYPEGWIRHIANRTLCCRWQESQLLKILLLWDLENTQSIYFSFRVSNCGAHLPTEFWSLFLLRSFPPPVRAADAGCWHSLVLPGAGSRSGHPAGQHRSVEVHLPQARRDRLLQLCGKKLIVRCQKVIMKRLQRGRLLLSLH